MPVVSDDALTWTFSLKPGITYGPPLQDVTVTSHDFVRALEREACGTCNVGGYSFYYSAIKGLERSTMYARCEDPNSHWALCTGTGWGKDYPDGFTFAPPLFSRSAIGPESCCNDTMVGVTPEMLSERDYAVVDVPNAESQIEKCIPLTGDERVRCWADLDTYLMEEVVPWVPYLFDNDVGVASQGTGSAPRPLQVGCHAGSRKLSARSRKARRG